MLDHLRFLVLNAAVNISSILLPTVFHFTVRQPAAGHRRGGVGVLCGHS
jgi:hypothetical protein